jgi:hypothetical protein
MTTRTIARGIGALALTLAAVVLVPAPAHAAAYRYWTYWQAPVGAAAWDFATQGPGTAVPADGAVEGWAFGVTTESGSKDDAPATPPDFAALCGATPAEPGRKRVALVVDSGPAAFAPKGQVTPSALATCVVADAGATGYDVLRSVVEVRTDGGLVCGVAGYPTDECAALLDADEAAALLAGAAAAGPEPSATASVTGMPGTTDGTTDVGAGSPVATVVVAALLIGAAAYFVRRQRSVR